MTWATRINSSIAFLCLTVGAYAEVSDKASVLAGVDDIHPRMLSVNQAIWSYAEPGLEETRSSKELADWLAESGFSVRTGVAGMPTAFVASYGNGKPVIAYLAEYDALIGVSQKAVPHPEQRDDPLIIAGHGCGHSVFGTGSTAAAIALAQVMALKKLPGTVRLYGTPAEETVDAKTFMLRDGLFDDVDVVLSWHTSDQTGASYRYSKAVLGARFAFAGVAAHASAAPQFGRSALDAIELMNIGVNYLREHVPQDTRIHYVVTDGGGQPNVVPPKAASWYYVRADRHDTVEQVYARIVDVARGAALMTGTELSYVVDGDAHEVLPNRALSHIINDNLQKVGPPQFDDKERAFARISPVNCGPRSLRRHQSRSRRAWTGDGVDGPGRSLLVRADGKPDGCILCVRRSRPLLAGCGLDGNEHRREGDDCCRQDPGGHGIRSPNSTEPPRAGARVLPGGPGSAGVPQPASRRRALARGDPRLSSVAEK